jgi:hypothetical protein
MKVAIDDRDWSAVGDPIRHRMLDCTESSGSPKPSSTARRADAHHE